MKSLLELFNMEEYLKLASYEYTTSHFCLSGETGSSLRLVQTFLPKFVYVAQTRLSRHHMSSSEK